MVKRIIIVLLRAVFVKVCLIILSSFTVIFLRFDRLPTKYNSQILACKQKQRCGWRGPFNWTTVCPHNMTQPTATLISAIRWWMRFRRHLQNKSIIPSLFLVTTTSRTPVGYRETKFLLAHSFLDKLIVIYLLDTGRHVTSMCLARSRRGKHFSVRSNLILRCLFHFYFLSFAVCILW